MEKYRREERGQGRRKKIGVSMGKSLVCRWREKEIDRVRERERDIEKE
jgi:hypothetical protein